MATPRIPFPDGRRFAFTLLDDTHLGKGFVRGGRIDPAVEDALRYLATLPDWFVPVSDVLEHLVSIHPAPFLAPWERWRLEVGHYVSRRRLRFRAWRERRAGRVPQPAGAAA